MFFILYYLYKMKKTLILWTLLLGTIALTGCGQQSTNEILTGEDILIQTWAEDSRMNTTGMANPASEYCVSQGGTSEIRKDKDGAEFGVCILSNGEEREEWNFYRESQYVGLSLADAEAKAKESGVEFRIAEQDGEAKALTMDLRPGRVNAVVNSGVVTSVVIE